MESGETYGGYSIIFEKLEACAEESGADQVSLSTDEVAELDHIRVLREIVEESSTPLQTYLTLS